MKEGDKCPNPNCDGHLAIQVLPFQNKLVCFTCNFVAPEPKFEYTELEDLNGATIIEATDDGYATIILKTTKGTFKLRTFPEDGATLIEKMEEESN